MRLSMVSAALVAALVGYGSTIALVLAAAAAVNATPVQTTSWVLAVCVAKGVGSAWLSWWARVPVVLAWSTPGTALVAATTGITMAEAVGAFVLSGCLVLLTGAVRPLGRLVARIPDAIAGAMLAGVLLPFCLRLPAAVSDLPVIVLAMVAVFGAVRLWNPALAVLAALGVGVGLAFLTGSAAPDLTYRLPTLTFIGPEFRLDVLIGLGIPLYLVTMASQNLPGFATMRAHGFEPPVQPALIVTGGLSAASALAGAHPISMAAITAAICMGPDVEPDGTRRWRVGLVYGAIWVALGVAGPLILAVLAALPPALIAAVVALALLGPFTGAATGAFAVPSDRFAAAVTLVVTASGVAFFGVGAAFWGLVAGLAVWGMERAARQRAAPPPGPASSRTQRRPTAREGKSGRGRRPLDVSHVWTGHVVSKIKGLQGRLNEALGIGRQNGTSSPKFEVVRNLASIFFGPAFSKSTSTLSPSTATTIP